MHQHSAEFILAVSGADIVFEDTAAVSRRRLAHRAFDRCENSLWLPTTEEFRAINHAFQPF